MAIKPRIMIIDSLCTFHEEGSQSLGLTLLDRVASADFHKQFLQGPQVELAKALDYAREHSIIWLSKPHSSFAHKRNIEVSGTKHHLGDVLTEQEAFDFGYVEPHIDTCVCKIVETALALPRKTSEKLTRALRKKSLITLDYSVIYTPKIHVVANDRLKYFEHKDFRAVDHDFINKSHTISLMVFEPGEDNLVPVGVLGYYVPQKNITFAFMTYVPVK